MSDGGYSRLEKDFLGNERMVHYDGSGNMLGASDVVREPDGTVRINNDAVPTYQTGDLPHVEVIEPKKAASPTPPTDVAKPTLPMNQTIMYTIATFIAALLLTLGALSFFRTRGSSGDASIQSPPQFNQNRPAQTIPNSTPSPSTQENFPNDPKPRNDEPAPDARPFDQASPDSKMDDNHPKIQDNNSDSDPKPEVKPKKVPEDPIDLRGDDGDKNKKTTTGGDPLKGDDIH